MKIGIMLLATNSYFVLGIRFIKRFNQFYKGNAEIVFHMFTDEDPSPYLPDDINVKYHHTTHNNWVDATNSKFSSIISIEDEIADEDFDFYFDADTNVDKDFTEDWFLGESVGGQHYADQSWMKEVKGFDRNPRSKAYVPITTPLQQTYFYGAFFGGAKAWMIDFCKLMRFYQLEDKKIPYEPGVNDESYINREFHYNRPSKVVPCTEFKFLISDKGGIGETRRMDLNLEPIKKVLREKREVNINITNGAVISVN